MPPARPSTPTGATAELSLFKGGLAWRVLYYASSTEVYDAFVDARTGRVLQAHNMVKEAAPALVWERYPGAPLGGTQRPSTSRPAGT